MCCVGSNEVFGGSTDYLNAWEVGSSSVDRLAKTPKMSFFHAADDTRDIYCMPGDHTERGQGVGAEEDHRHPLYKGPPTNYNSPGGLLGIVVVVVVVRLNGVVVSALGIRTRRPRFDSRDAPLFHWLATLGKLFTHIASPVSQLQETGVQKGVFAT